MTTSASAEDGDGNDVESEVQVNVTVTGVDEPIYENVMARLAINLHKDNERLGANAIRRLHRQAEADIQSALAPFGYYNPVIKSNLGQEGDVFNAEYTIDTGPPVIVHSVLVEVSGSGENNKQLLTAESNFPLSNGDVLDQSLYELGKKKLMYAALSEGFLDATFTKRALRINRETNSADVTLVLDSGQQYLFGEISSTQEVLNQDLLDRYLPFSKGQPYNPAKLFELQSSLYRTDYFSRVTVVGQTDDAQDLNVPVEIKLTPPKYLNKYSFGVGYATDTGIRGKIDWSNRLLNSRGHKISGSLQLAEYENLVSLSYDIPRGNPRYNKQVHRLTYQDKEWDDTETQLFTAAVIYEYSGPRFNLSGGLEYRDEVYDIGNTSGDSTLLVPALTAGMVFADDILHTKDGLQASVSLLGSLDGPISDASFLQGTVNGKAIISPIEDWRLIGRGSLGSTLVNSIDSLPPSLRFYTGGDSTIRGYKFKSIGTEDSAGEVIGGRYLVVGSIELERVVTELWSLAAFWDVGTATDDLSLDFSQGVGGGVRLRLPFGQIRLDIASAITEDGNPLRVHLNVGGDL
ncbi:MAG: outer membrane protein assembly factor [Desulfobulbaceae bacterium]|nr:outer membrane protein assembly factor [Desulfobulbaceae bacterium]